MARFIVGSIVDENASVTVRTISCFKVRLTKLRIVVYPRSLTEVRRGFQRAKSSIEKLLLQLLISLLDVSSVSLFTSVLFRVYFAFRNSIRNLLLSLSIFKRIEHSYLFLRSLNDLCGLYKLNGVNLIF